MYNHADVQLNIPRCILPHHINRTPPFEIVKSKCRASVKFRIFEEKKSSENFNVLHGFRKFSIICSIKTINNDKKIHQRWCFSGGSIDRMKIKDLLQFRGQNLLRRLIETTTKDQNFDGGRTL